MDKENNNELAINQENNNENILENETDETQLTNETENKELEPLKYNPPPKTLRLTTALALIALLLVANTLFMWQLVGKDSLNIKGLPSITSNASNETSKFLATYDYITKYFYKDVDKKKLIESAIKGMMEGLDDPYSEYMDAEVAKSFDDSIAGEFDGIGAEITSKDDEIVIVSPIKDSPAEKAGLKANDIIESVDGQNLTGMTTTEAVKFIRGKKGTKVSLVIRRPGVDKSFSVEIIRDKIPVITVTSEMLDNKIGKISVSMFSENTGNDFAVQIRELTNQGMSGLIIDLRGNPGGILSVAENMANQFIPNKKIIVQTEERGQKRQITYADDNGGFKVKVPVVVLVDEGSASASEVLTAALSESASATVVGVTTFGKGTMQTAKGMTDQSEIKMTVGKWLTPSGKWINEKGITPDILAELPSYTQLSIINPETEFKLGTISPEVENVEQMLLATGYSISKIDDTFDGETENAVKMLQKDNALEENGVLTGKTTMMLMEKLRQKIIKNDTQLEAAINVFK